MADASSRSSYRQSPAPLRGFSPSPDDEPMGMDCCGDEPPWWRAPAGQFYLSPTALVQGDEAAMALASGQGRRLAGRDDLAFTALTGLWRGAGGEPTTRSQAPLATWTAWATREGAAVAAHVEEVLAHLSAPRRAFAGLAMDRPRIMGIVNVTPDSFSDGGWYFDTEVAVEHGKALLNAGADILDIGGESTRPGAAPVTPGEEAARIMPVIRALAELGALISVDTRHASVMRQALEGGARIVNDIAALEGEGALAAVAEAGCPAILMHMQGEPGTMQHEPDYACAPLDVFDYLAARVAACARAGIARENLCVDPGIGFGKTLEHNVEVLRTLGLYHGLGLPLLLGASRKTLIARLSRDEAAVHRLPGSLALAIDGAAKGAQILRVHDADETRQALAVAEAVRG